MAFSGMRLFRGILLFFSVSLFLGAQPTFNALARTMRVQSKYGTGTIFNIDVEGREYWVTATHILTGAKGKPYGRIAEKTVELKLLNPGGKGLEWFPVNFTVLQPAEDVDVVALIAQGLILTAVKMPALPPPQRA